MQNLKKPRRAASLLVLGLVGSFFGSAGLFLSQGPDFDLVLDRRIPSKLSAEHLDRNLSSPSRWTQWFHSLSQVIGPNTVEKGAQFTLKIDPKKGKRKQFDLQARVIDFIPGRLLRLEITQDSSGRLTHLFDHLEWKIEIEPVESNRPLRVRSGPPPQSMIRGLGVAHTHHWRARLFGRLAEKIVMNQVFYPNLIQLADLQQPFAIDEAPHLPAGSL